MIADYLQWFLGALLILSSLGVVLAKNPVHSSLSFLLTLMTLASLYLALSAQFIAVMQVLVYAGAILVIFMFVIVLFQDAHMEIVKEKPRSKFSLLLLSGSAFLLTLLNLGRHLTGITSRANQIPDGFGSVETIGKALYIDYFFPFEAVILLFLIAIVGALYIGRKAT